MDDTPTIVIREIPYPQAKKEIADFIKKHGEADLVEIQDNLRLDLQLIVKIMKELQKEGKIEWEADSNDKK